MVATPCGMDALGSFFQADFCQLRVRVVLPDLQGVNSPQELYEWLAIMALSHVVNLSTQVVH